MSERNKRKSLSISQKLHIINTINVNPFKRKALIAEELEAPFSSTCNVWRDRQKYLNSAKSGCKDLSRKRACTANFEAVDEKSTTMVHGFKVHVGVAGILFYCTLMYETLSLSLSHSPPPPPLSLPSSSPTLSLIEMLFMNHDVCAARACVCVCVSVCGVFV